MRGLDNREHARGPPLLVQARAEVDVFVVGEERGIEEAFADRGTAIERGRRGHTPGGWQLAVGSWQLAVSDLAEGAVADVDAGAIDRAVLAADDRLHRSQLGVVVKRAADRREPVSVAHRVV